MGFIVLDLILLALCTAGAFYFARKHKDKMHKEGWMYLYKTSYGLQFIDKVAKKYRSILLPLQYVIITSGYCLMIGMFYLLFKTLFIYLAQSSDAPLAKVPAVFPLIPYFPELFNLDSVFPPFYFFYFIVAIAIVALSHEAAHGILARLNNVRIKTTGVAFLGPFLGAFVEQDDKQMNKAPVKAQLAILAAGTFANVVMAVLFSVLLFLFIYAYDDAPAFKAQIPRTILAINTQPITSYALLNDSLTNAQPGESIAITGLTSSGEQTVTEVILAERNGRAYLGIASAPYHRKGLLGAWYMLTGSIRNPSLHYEASLPAAQFIYDLLWWIVIINILVALFNMFPAGMLDGGRFLYLTVLKLTKSKKLATHSFKLSTYLLLAVVAVMMVKWVWVIIT